MSSLTQTFKKNSNIHNLPKKQPKEIIPESTVLNQAASPHKLSASTFEHLHKNYLKRHIRA